MENDCHYAETSILWQNQQALVLSVSLLPLQLETNYSVGRCPVELVQTVYDRLAYSSAADVAVYASRATKLVQVD